MMPRGRFIKPRMDVRTADVGKVGAAEHFGDGSITSLVPPASSALLVEAKPLSPEEAAEYLLPYLPEDTQRLIREAAQHQTLPLWRLLLGYVMRCAERGELFSSYQLAAWTSGRLPNSPRPCAKCGLEFVSRFPDAENCCNACFFGRGHSDGCPARQGVLV